MIVRAAKAAIGAVVAFVLGLHVMIQLLLYAIAADIATGVIAAWMRSDLDSAVSRKGVGRKVLIILFVSASEIVGRHLNLQASTPWGTQVGLGAAVAGYYCVHEAISIVENLARSDVPIPAFILERLRQWNGRRDETS